MEDEHIASVLALDPGARVELLSPEGARDARPLRWRPIRVLSAATHSSPAPSGNDFAELA